MSPIVYSISKIWASVALVVVSLLGVIWLQGQGILAYVPAFLAFFGLIGIHSVTPTRDYLRQPVTQAEIDLSVSLEKREMLTELIRHIESSAHRNCGPDCPAPDLVTKVGMKLT